MNAIALILRTQRILWAALTLAPFAYLFVAVFAAPAPKAPPSPILLPVLVAVSASVAALSFVLPASMFARALRQRVGTDIKVGPVATQSPFLPEGGFRTASPSAAEVEDPIAALRVAASLDQTPMIVTLALRESVALYGLVLAMVGFPITAAAPFIAASVALMLLRFPSVEGLRRRVEKVLDARVPAP